MVSIFNGTKRSIDGSKKQVYVQLEHDFINHMINFKGAKMNVWILLCLCINEEGWSFPSIEFIADKTGYSITEVKRTLKEIRELKIKGRSALLCVKIRRNGRWASNGYLLIPMDEEIEKYKNGYFLESVPGHKDFAGFLRYKEEILGGGKEAPVFDAPLFGPLTRTTSQEKTLSPKGGARSSLSNGIGERSAIASLNSSEAKSMNEYRDTVYHVLGNLGIKVWDAVGAKSKLLKLLTFPASTTPMLYAFGYAAHCTDGSDYQNCQSPSSAAGIAMSMLERYDGHPLPPFDKSPDILGETTPAFLKYIW